MLKLFYPSEPKAIQSVRSRNAGKFIQHYQPKGNVEWKNFIKLFTLDKLPADFKLMEGAVKISIVYMYTPPKSTTKRDLKRMAEGEVKFKITKPDLMDNLAKGLCDALTGIVWKDDCLVSMGEVTKVYADRCGIGVLIEELDSFMKIADLPAYAQEFLAGEVC